MSRLPHTLAILAAFSLLAFGQAEEPKEESHAQRIQTQRKRLAELKEGADSKQVISTLGKPDEVREVPQDDLLDGLAVIGGVKYNPDLGPETQRWAYGVLGKGKFSAVGYVSMDRNGKVVAVTSADCFANYKLPDLVQAESDQSAESPAKMRCHLSAVKIVSAQGDFKATVTLQNKGEDRFALRHDAANSMKRFLLIEIYDSKKRLLFRENMMSYHSPFSLDPEKWPELTIPSGAEKSEVVYVSPSHGFGQLPTGTYSMRVYFPFDKQKYYSSNLVRFEIP